MQKKDIKPHQLLAYQSYPGSDPEPVTVLDTVSLWTKGWSKKRKVDLYQRSEDSRYNVQGGYAGYPRVVTGYLALSLDNDHNHGELRDKTLNEMLNVVAGLPAELTATDVNALRAVLPDGVVLGVWNNRNFAGDWKAIEAEHQARAEKHRKELERLEAEFNRRQALGDLVATAAEARGIQLDHYQRSTTARIKLTDLAQLLDIPVPDQLAGE